MSYHRPPWPLPGLRFRAGACVRSYAGPLYVKHWNVFKNLNRRVGCHHLGWVTEWEAGNCKPPLALGALLEGH